MANCIHGFTSTWNPYNKKFMAQMEKLRAEYPNFLINLYDWDLDKQIIPTKIIDQVKILPSIVIEYNDSYSLIPGFSLIKPIRNVIRNLK